MCFGLSDSVSGSLLHTRRLRTDHGSQFKRRTVPLSTVPSASVTLRRQKAATMSTTKTSVSVPLIPAWELPSLP